MTKPTHIHKQEGTSYCGKPVGSDPFNTIEEAFTYNRESKAPCVGCIRRIKAYLDTEVTSRVKILA